MPKVRPPEYLLQVCQRHSAHSLPARTLARTTPQLPRRSFVNLLPRRSVSAAQRLMQKRQADLHISGRERKRRRASPSPAQSSKKAMAQATPTIQLTPIESTLRRLLLDVAQYIRDKEIVAGGSDVVNHPETILRFTGGWVRDKLLGVDSHDIDVGISSMTGYQFGMAIKQFLDEPSNLKRYEKDHPNGQMNKAFVSLHKIEANPEKSKHLETVTTKIFGLDIDLVNLRKETYSEDSRNPQMEFGTAVEDALRRDATINALFYNLNESRLEDLTERGLDDLKAKIIRTPLEPYQTFKDDPLRVLRLIRFASRLGYQIDQKTEEAMQNENISIALKLKISRERVGIEVEKMLRGPDPHGALQFIDRLQLYHTIFANHKDDVVADLSKWSVAYNALARLQSSRTEGLVEDQAVERVRRILIGHDDNVRYYAWVIAAFAPWTSIPARIEAGNKSKAPSERPVEVGRDSLRFDNKTLNILRDGALYHQEVIQWKSSLLSNDIKGTPAVIRQQIALRLRSWGQNWNLCVVLAILQEVMRGRDFNEVVREYDQFLAYIVEKDLARVYELRPIVNGAEIMEVLKAKKGPWMSKAMEMTIEWQFLHPEGDKKTALKELSDRRGELGL